MLTEIDRAWEWQGSKRKTILSNQSCRRDQKFFILDGMAAVRANNPSPDRYLTVEVTKYKQKSHKLVVSCAPTHRSDRIDQTDMKAYEADKAYRDLTKSCNQ